MEASTPRFRFQIADPLVLIAATAVLIAMVRYYGFMPIRLTPVIPREGVLRFDAGYQPVNASTLAITTSIVLAAFSPALLWMSLRRPRPPIAELVRRPGAWACFVGTVVAWRSMLFVGLDEWRRGWPSVFEVPAMVGDESRTAYVDLLPSAIFPWLRAAVGPWMIGLLVVMVFVGQWRGNAARVEVAGRCLGAAWILLYLTTLR